MLPSRAGSLSRGVINHLVIVEYPSRLKGSIVCIHIAPTIDMKVSCTAIGVELAFVFSASAVDPDPRVEESGELCKLVDQYLVESREPRAINKVCVGSHLEPVTCTPCLDPVAQFH